MCITMPFYGSIVVIRRSGVDGSIFPLVSSECLLGRAEGCDIRVQLPTVSREHCRISVNQSEQVSQNIKIWDFCYVQYTILCFLIKLITQIFIEK